MATEFAEKMDDVEPLPHQQTGRVSLSAIHLIAVGALLLIVLLALAY